MACERPALDPTRAAAAYRLGILSGEEARDFARAAIEAGHWSGALDDMATEREPAMRDMGPLLEVVLADLGVPIPPAEQAVWDLLRAILGDVVAGSVPPWVAVRQICWDIYHGCDLDTLPGDRQWWVRP